MKTRAIHYITSADQTTTNTIIIPLKTQSQTHALVCQRFTGMDFMFTSRLLQQTIFTQWPCSSDVRLRHWQSTVVLIQNHLHRLNCTTVILSMHVHQSMMLVNVQHLHKPVTYTDLSRNDLSNADTDFNINCRLNSCWFYFNFPCLLQHIDRYTERFGPVAKVA